MAISTNKFTETLGSLLFESAKEWGDSLALAIYGRDNGNWTYQELWNNSTQVASYLTRRGVTKGDRVIIWGDNRPEWVAAFFGSVLIGAIVVPLDAQSTGEFFSLIENETQPAFMFLGSEQLSRTEPKSIETMLFDDFKDLIQPLERTREIYDFEPISPEDVAELVFTSGTTGRPKGVILTHGNICSNVKMAGAAFEVTPSNRVLAILPLSHMFEQVADLLVPLSGGALIIYISTLRPDVIFGAMSHYGVTNMGCVPRVLELFADGIKREARVQGKLGLLERIHRIACKLPFAWRPKLFKSIHRHLGGSFKYFVVGGARLDPLLGRWWEGLGIKVVQGYGMTEASPVVSSGTLTDRDHSSVGRPLPGVEVKIADDEEILVRGPNVTTGYWQNDIATQNAFQDGWYMTRDLGYFDNQGRLHIRGRKDNMFVLPNGMNVYPEDIEQVLYEDSRLADAVVLGLEFQGDMEVHGVVLTDDTAAVPDIIRTANQKLASHQRIVRYTAWPEATFPMTPTMKPKRTEILSKVMEMRNN